MPEGHTLHRIASQYHRRFAGAITRSTSPQGRFATESAVLDGRVMTAAEAYGKHLFCHFDQISVHVHLGLLGKIAFTKGIAPEPVGALRWRLHRPDDGGNTADLRGPTACEILDPIQVETILARLGPDPLRAESDPLTSWKRISRSRAPIAALLMDQSIAAGVGNIYRAELLYRHRVDPMMEGRLLRKSEWLAMWEDLVVLMHDGVVKGRIDTVRDEHSPDAQGRVPRTDRHGGEVYVYRRAGQKCLVCQAQVRTAELGGRNLFWCPRCQRATRRRPKV